jgi:NADH-dependent peroxiredoxin subunit F
MYELIIIGGGPAGMTAAVYAARKKIKTLMLAREIGGQVMWTSSIENYMGYQYVEGIELMEKFEAQLKQFPIERQDGEEVQSVSKEGNIFEVRTVSGKLFQSNAVIVATGKKPRKLGIPGEDGLIGKGVSYCAVCDAPVFSEMPTAVVGGGNSALEAILDLLKIASQVFSISEAGFTGDAVLVERIHNDPKLKIYPHHRPLEIRGQDFVEEMLIEDLRSGEKLTIPVKGIFIEIGLTPNSTAVKGLTALNSDQEIKVNCQSATAVPGLFAAGDVADTPEKQIIIAAGDGAKAALQAQKYLQRMKN